MVGNDIVDLSGAILGEGNRRDRYINKVLTPSEIRIVNNLGGDDKWIWLLWSLKESVYKIVSRAERRVRFRQAPG